MSISEEESRRAVEDPTFGAASAMALVKVMADNNLTEVVLHRDDTNYLGNFLAVERSKDEFRFILKGQLTQAEADAETRRLLSKKAEDKDTVLEQLKKGEIPDELWDHIKDLNHGLSREDFRVEMAEDGVGVVVGEKNHSSLTTDDQALGDPSYAAAVTMTLVSLMMKFNVTETYLSTKERNQIVEGDLSFHIKEDDDGVEAKLLPRNGGTKH